MSTVPEQADSTAQWPVRATDLVLSRGGRSVLASSTFRLPRGSVTALIGPNGSGKSSLLDALAGLLPPQQGSLEVLGTQPRRARPRVAYVLQSTVVNDLLPVSVRQVVTMARYPGRGLLGRLAAADHRAVDAALERLDVADLADRQLHELSGGQRQRVLVAQGLAQDAPMLLLDEPMSGVDLASRERILAALAEERRRSRTIILATHDLGEAQDADYVLLLDARVVAAGPPSQVITSGHLAEAYGARVVLLDAGATVVDAPDHPDRTRPAKATPASRRKPT